MTEPAREVPRLPAVVHNTISGNSPHPSIQAGAIDKLACWWRSATAARPPVCLLLDGVTHADQIRALTSGGSGHLVVATSRLPLAGGRTVSTAPAEGAGA
ncbi:regulator protein [Streptomyces laurentii]|uniref:Regulator protein n=1 Tax=Streptomyces laurentii TaxID=39478 RepID=A0A169PJI7_STRLU|nr:regulator protein [Streptomyces laurentii]